MTDLRKLLRLCAIVLAGHAPAVGTLVRVGVAPAAELPTAERRTVPVTGGGAYTDVDAAGLRAMLTEKTFPLINVHVPYEGELAGTDLFIPFDQIEAHLAKLPADKDAKIVLYCRSGGMSAAAASALVKRGYTNVWNLDGGMVGWEWAGYPLVQRSR